jgi:hypothetical protein
MCLAGGFPDLAGFTQCIEVGKAISLYHISEVLRVLLQVCALAL